MKENKTIKLVSEEEMTTEANMSIITKEIKDELAVQISAELFAKGKISEDQYIEDVIDILGMMPAEYSPEKVKRKKCWI